VRRGRCLVNALARHSMVATVLTSFSQFSSLQLIPRLAQNAPARTHNDSISFLPRAFCEYIGLGEEAVAGVDGVDVVSIDEFD
jgi:hypothetical protein